jgi:hypothetical protein
MLATCCRMKEVLHNNCRSSTSIQCRDNRSVNQSRVVFSPMESSPDGKSSVRTALELGPPPGSTDAEGAPYSTLEERVSRAPHD